jgi:phage shock protein PspC (stress-responsive transcriptional regulator)
MYRKLYRSTTDKMVGGVCGGLGNYLGIDPVFVRLFFLLLLFGEGVGFWIYIALWIVIQPAPTPEAEPDQANWEDAGQELSKRAKLIEGDVREAVNKPHPQAGLIIGGALILFGVVQLLDNLNVHLSRWFNWNYIWPLILIGGGVIWIVRGVKGNDQNDGGEQEDVAE